MVDGLGMDLTPTEIRKALENPANQPQLEARALERFNAMELAAVLEQEIRRCEASGLSHIRVNMNLVDCAGLARALRRAALLGG